MVTKQQIAAALDVVKAVADAIKEAGRIPAGTLYAAMTAHGMSLSSFEQIVGILVRGGLVERTPSHELVWLL